jgi:hypothetical protein
MPVHFFFESERQDQRGKNMDTVVNYIKNQNISDYIMVIKMLMEAAEKQSSDGETKLDLVLSAWTQISTSPEFTNIFRGVSMQTVQAVIEAIILATKTSVAVNKSTGCFKSCLAMFKKSPSP